MAAFHAEVLAALGHPFTVVANSAERAAPLAERHGAGLSIGGLSQALLTLPRPDAAIVVLPVDRLAEAGLALIRAGVPRVLLEKPGALDAAGLAPLQDAVQDSGSAVFIAYNRRFMASVREARRRIRAAGQVLSFSFEFCEDSDRITALPTADAIKKCWLLANSSHVIDLAFHLCGRPMEWSYLTSGSLDWHHAAADFRGMGVTQSAARFSYFADWRGPGRWGIEIVLPTERLVLRPIEALSVIPRGSFTAKLVELDDRLDRSWKPGLYAQSEGFLAAVPDPDLVTLDEQIAMIRDVYMPMANYSGPINAEL